MLGLCSPKHIPLLISFLGFRLVPVCPIFPSAFNMIISTLLLISASGWGPVQSAPRVFQLFLNYWYRLLTSYFLCSTWIRLQAWNRNAERASTAPLWCSHSVIFNNTLYNINIYYNTIFANDRVLELQILALRFYS